MTRTNSIRFIHTSDWQLGMTRHFLSEEAAPRFSQARIDAITRLGVLATENQASFIVVAGDVFESNQLSRQTVRRALDALQTLPVPIFLLPGNHDPLNGSSVFLTEEFTSTNSNIIVINDEKPMSVPGLQAVEVVGAPWRTKHPSSDLCAQLLSGLDPMTDTVRVTVAHGQVDSLSPDKSRPEVIDLETAEAAIRGGKIHYLALGDRHSLTEIGNTGRIWYSGAPVATDFDEIDPNKALLVDLGAGSDCVVRPLDVGDWRFIERDVPLNSDEDLARIDGFLAEVPNKARTIIKMGFVGSINLATAAGLDAVFASHTDSFASLRRRERTTDLAIVPDQLDQDSVELSGYAKDTWDQLMSEAEERDEVAQDALRLLYRLSKHGAAP